MNVHILGVRGSCAAPGRASVRYGGNTPCVAVAHDEGLPTLVLDAGTGIRSADRLLEGRPFQGSILLGHLHWDHTQGLPFFGCADNVGARVRLLAPAQGDIEALLDRLLSPPHFPITLGELRGEWRVEGIEQGTSRIEGFSVLALQIPHQGGRTFGYRIEDGRSTLAYISDHDGPDVTAAGWAHDPAVLALVQGVDLLIHDAQYVDSDRGRREMFGHSTAAYAVRLAEDAGAGEVLLFHHDPDRSDDEIDEIVAAHSSERVRVRAAAEGMSIGLPDPAGDPTYAEARPG